MLPLTPQQLQHEVSRRRTFAIISHPDAGKTTLTEKLLLYGGCVEVAGVVRGRKAERAATSDWMEIERQRGISVSSTVLPFEYQGFRINLLDTPGHHDFSEDTYRTLMAADCAVMVIDLAKGVEPQTLKLFAVCKLRKIPVLTFVNKVDRPGHSPLEILSEIEAKLGIEPVPMNWPIAAGRDFRGLVDMSTGLADLFEEATGALRVPFRTSKLEDLRDLGLHSNIGEMVIEEVELLRSAGTEFDHSQFLAGQTTPVYFGSALKNYGIEQFLAGFLAHSPPPRECQSDQGPLPPTRTDFAGFVFKIQANLDPRHRDRVAFLRVCSGRFVREMDIHHTRTGKRMQLRQAHLVFGRERETVVEAYPGDIVGLVNPGAFRLGDTLCEGPPVEFAPLPQFSPEHFATLGCQDTSRRKQFERGIGQLIEEGALQTFTDPLSNARETIVAAVGELQFEVARYRLRYEYNTETTFVPLPFNLVRWASVRSPGTTPPRMRLPYAARRVKDQYGETAVLLHTERDSDVLSRDNPDYQFSAARIPPARRPAS